MGVGADGLCTPCRIGSKEGPEARARYLSELGRRGAAARKRREKAGLKKDELPPLKTHQNAMQWLEILGRAVATGRIYDKQATAATRAVEAWLKAYAEGSTAKELESLRKKLHEVKQLRRAS